MLVSSLRAVLGSWNRNTPLFEFGMGQGLGVSHRAFDAEAEEVADPTDVSAGGVDLLEDAVFSQSLGAEVCPLPGELFADRDEPWCTDAANEQVRVDAVGPGSVAVVEPGGEPDSYRAGQGMSRPSRASRPSTMSVSWRPESCLAVRAWKATRAIPSATAGSGESSALRMAPLSRGRGTVVFTAVSGIPRVGLVKISLRALSTLNSDRSPYSAQLRRAPVSGRAACTCSRVISARDW